MVPLQDISCMLLVSVSHSNMQYGHMDDVIGTSGSCVNAHFFVHLNTRISSVSSAAILRMSYCFSAVKSVLWIYGSSVQQPYQVCSQFGHEHIRTYCQLS